MRDTEEIEDAVEALFEGELAVRPEQQIRVCEWPGCKDEGGYRAPRSPAALREFRWFCLDHVRAYNQGWDYFARMSPEEIEAHRRADVTGHRPTWPMGLRADFDFASARVRDYFSVYGAGPNGAGRRGTHGGGRRPQSESEKAMAVMDLERGATVKELKARYKFLVKIHHPDANGGDRKAEERLKKINAAYTYLITNGLP